MDDTKTVLVVDDQSAIRFILKQMFDKLGYQCVLASGGEDALKIIEQKDELNILLCDVHMQDMSGLDVLESCKQINPKLPVILMSAYSKDEIIVEALRKGASDYLIKPFEIQQLKSVVRRVEELYHNRDQIIENRDLVGSLELNFEIPSRDLDIYKVQSLLKNTVQIYSRISNKDLLNLSLIFEEALMNAHEHGNLELVSTWKEDFITSSGQTRFEHTKQERLVNPIYGNRSVKIQMHIESAKIRVSIEDDGNGYSVGETGSEAGGKPFGMGLMLIQSLSDSLEFNDSGTRITFEKFIPAENHENSDS